MRTNLFRVRREMRTFLGQLSSFEKRERLKNYPRKIGMFLEDDNGRIKNPKSKQTTGVLKNGEIISVMLRD